MVEADVFKFKPTVMQLLNRLLKRFEHERLPGRVQESIRRQQESSEILIGWLQLAIVLAFSVLYAVSPKPYESVDVVAREPWFLGFYLVFTVIRLALAHARRLPDWLVYLSIVMDMTLLLALIFSIHVKYQQPPSFYLKVPTLLYIFIFIALRALRYEVRHVLLAGSVAALGWLLMVWYVVQVDPQDPMITRNYVEYMTSNSVLLGAEFDKVISILMVTAILAIAIARARGLLVRSVVEGSAVEDLSKFVPRGVARQLKLSERRMEVGDGEVREATILFTDIEGFTTISESLSPTELIKTLNAYFEVVSLPIERHGGVINQFQGDAILATFNVPDDLEDHALRAVHAAVEIQQALAAQTFGKGLKLRSRIGINSGVVVGGLVGSGDRLGYTVHGDEVNLAARLEQLNKDYGTQIIVSARTRELAGADAFPFKEVDTVTVRGRHSSLVVYSIDSEPE